MTTHIRRCRLCTKECGEHTTCEDCNQYLILDKIWVDKQTESEKDGK